MASPAPPPSSPPPTPFAPSPVGDRDGAVVLAGRYRLERRIGQGGMAEVWVATDLQLDRKVAVKWLKPSLAADAVVAERFRREAIAVARLNHPNIVAVHDVFVHDGRQAVVMQLVDGKSLRQLLDGQKRLGPELTIHIGAAVAGALDEAHRAGFVHRDVKPGNILVTSDGRVLLTDFGIAKGLSVSDEDLTSDDVMMGTAKYLSPEQVRGRKLDGRADLYSLGLVLYECLAGRVPFLGETDADTALARLQRDPTDLNRLRPTLPRGLVDLVHQTLARNPAHRPSSGAELRDALLTVDTTPPHVDGTPSEPPRRGPLVRHATPPNPTRPAVPGEPTRRAVDGEPSSTASAGTPRVVAPRPASNRRSDNTPTTGAATRGRPARGLEQPSNRSGTVIGILMLLAVVVVLLIAMSLRLGDENQTPTTVTVESTVGVTAPPSAAPVDITTVTAFDPDGDNGSENDGQASAALADGTAATAWFTECYSSRFMGGKRGVGLIVTLSGPTPSVTPTRLSVDAVNAPYQLEIFASDAEVAPSDPDAWGSPLAGTAYSEIPDTVRAELPVGARHALVWLRELGPDDACSGSNPYRGGLGEITVTG